MTRDQVTSTLSTLISNAMLLLGGVVMCFVTSWQLSMVAYTTVLPITHVTEAYAKWSGKINRQIFQHYSDSTAQVAEGDQQHPLILPHARTYPAHL